MDCQWCGSSIYMHFFILNFLKNMFRFCENGSLVLKIFLAGLGIRAIGLFHKHFLTIIAISQCGSSIEFSFVPLYKFFFHKKIMILGFFRSENGNLASENISKHVKFYCYVPNSVTRFLDPEKREF